MKLVLNFDRAKLVSVVMGHLGSVELNSIPAIEKRVQAVVEQVWLETVSPTVSAIKAQEWLGDNAGTMLMIEVEVAEEDANVDVGNLVSLLFDQLHSQLAGMLVISLVLRAPGSTAVFFSHQ